MNEKRERKTLKRRVLSLLNLSDQDRSLYELSLMPAQRVVNSLLPFSQVWLLVPEQFMERLQEAREVVCIEGEEYVLSC